MECEGLELDARVVRIEGAEALHDDIDINEGAVFLGKHLGGSDATAEKGGGEGSGRSAAVSP